MVFAAKGGIKNGAHKGRRTSPAGTVSQPIGKPFNGQAKGLLWLTWRSYAAPPQYFIPPEGGASTRAVHFLFILFSFAFVYLYEIDGSILQVKVNFKSSAFQ